MCLTNIRTMKRIFNICAIFLIVACCENTLIDNDLQPTSDAELGDNFKAFESWIDMSQTNRFNESLFCNDWTLSKVTYETYVDGILTETQDATDWWSKMEYSIKDDHTLRSGSSNGIWLYSHNFIMMKFNGGYYYYEVVESKPDELCLKSEEFPIGITFIPYYTDKSGEHNFNIFEYVTTK